MPSAMTPAEQAAARIAAALPAGARPADGGSPDLLDLAWEASTLPALLPLGRAGAEAGRLHVSRAGPSPPRCST